MAEDSVWTADLLSRSRAGDAAAADELAQRVQPRLLDRARRDWRLRAAGFGADDAAQLTWEKFLERDRKQPFVARHRGAFVAYLLRIQNGVIVDEHRQRLAVKRGGGAGVHSLDVRPDSTTGPFAPPASPDDTPAEQARQREVLERFERELRGEEAELWRHYRECQDFGEVARRLGKTKDAVRLQFARLCARVVPLLRQTYGVTEDGP